MVFGEKFDIGKETLGMGVLLVSLHFFWCVPTRSDRVYMDACVEQRVRQR